jgi:hypothetical protein
VYYDTESYALSFSNAVVSQNSVSYSARGFSIRCVAETTTGIEDTQHTPSNMKIYPNPTKNSFIFESETGNTIKLYDMLGKEVLSQPFNSKAEINISHFPKGIYNVNVLSEGKVVGESKIVKE